jgi:hypothetical protein
LLNLGYKEEGCDWLIFFWYKKQTLKDFGVKRGLEQDD